MSSSDEESTPQIKVVKRRKRVRQPDVEDTPIELYSKKVLPTLRQTASDSKKQIRELKLQRSIERAKDLNRNSIDNEHKLKPDDDGTDGTDGTDGVQFVCDHPPISLTPPPSHPQSVCTGRLTKMDRVKNKLISDLNMLKSRALNEEGLNDSFDSNPTFSEFPPEEERTMLVKVRLDFKLYKILLNWNEPFFKVFSELAQLTNLKKQHLHLDLNDCKIEYSDTPAKLKLSVADIIEGFIIEKKPLSNKVECIQLNFQCNFEKTKRSYNLNKYEPLEIILQDYANAIQQRLSNLVFQFDGDNLDVKLTPNELELENDFCIDVMRKKINPKKR